MHRDYEINELAKEESWRLFRIIGEFVDGFDTLNGVEPAVTIYGSARVKPIDDLYLQTQETANLLGKQGFSIITGGGPGIMEAANKGAREAGAISIGLNIQLPMEQCLNTYTTMSISFHHFFVRKVMLVKYSIAFIAMPGGIGTLDELTEVLTLIQTHKIKPFPVILFNSAYWKGFIDWLRDYTLAWKFISPEDLNLVRVCDTPAEAAEIVRNWYQNQRITGRKLMG